MIDLSLFTLISWLTIKINHTTFMDSTPDFLAATAATAACLSTVPTSANRAQASESVISPAVFNHPGPAASADVTAIVTNVAARTATATTTTRGTATMTGAISETVLAVTPAIIPTMTPMSHQTKAQESLLRNQSCLQLICD